MHLSSSLGAVKTIGHHPMNIEPSYAAPRTILFSLLRLALLSLSLYSLFLTHWLLYSNSPPVPLSSAAISVDNPSKTAGVMSSPEEVKATLNERFEKIFWVDDEGDFHPHVCIICDKFVKPRNLSVLKPEVVYRNRDLLKPKRWNDVSQSLANCYRYEGDTGDEVFDDTNNDWTSDLLLSPRAHFVRNNDRRVADGFSCCSYCKYALSKRYMPKYAIANNYCVGTPPPCLICLRDVELALLTPTKTYGYCFAYTGGVRKKLKGSLSYYKVDPSSIARAVTHFDVLGMNRDIVVILHGNMMPEQKCRAREKNQIHTDKIMEALQWLIHNNEEWMRSNINLQEISENLRNPVIVDNSRTVEGSEDDANANLEKTETFRVYFPDGRMESLTGGQENIEEFQRLIREAQQSGYNIEFQCDLMKEAVSDFKDNNLVNSCLLQFPYGRGGMHEVRMKSDSSFTKSTDIQDYVEHLSRLSQPQFHHPLFSLILYNMSMKQMMVKTASWRVRSNVDATSLGAKLTEQDLDAAISERRNNGNIVNERGNGNGHRFLRAVDSTTKDVPHTNEAARKAKQDGEAIQHKFGMASIFLTVTPDDANSLVVQIYSREMVDGDDTRIGDLSDDDIANRGRLRNEIRIKHPGICAYYFELVMDSIIEDVIGWDLANQRPTEMPGLFGTPEAFSMAVEEQGRDSLHSHFQVWIKEYREAREKMYKGNSREQQNAKRDLAGMLDRVGSAVLFDTKRCPRNGIAQTAFPHPCTVPNINLRQPPVVCNEQTLRNLRHRDGQLSGGYFAYCPHCTKTWSNEEFVESYLINAVKVPGLTHFPDREVDRLKAMTIDYQKGAVEVDPAVVDAGFSHHSHVKSCFAACKSQVSSSSAKKRKDPPRIRADDYECRYHLPRGKKQRTTVDNATSAPVKWYLWDGTAEERHLMEMNIRRGQYDAFQNVSVPAISHSKLGCCNTNISGIFEGPTGYYQFKYNMKGTQDDDTEGYDRVAEATRKALARDEDSLRDSERSEALRRILAASFAHQKMNVCGAAMASYLTRNKSRFIMSHDSVWCPLRDLQALLTGGSAYTTIAHNGRTPFFQCYALHYLCRPQSLQDLRAYHFYSQYEVVKVNSRNRDELMYFEKNGSFHHPSYQQQTDSFLQGIQQRKKECLLKVFQFDFPDTADFGGSILDPNVPITSAMEQYSKLALLLFCPGLRVLDDILLDHSFTLKFRQLVQRGVIDQECFDFLQNIQDTRSNCTRAGKTKDELQRNTTPFKPADQAFDAVEEEEDEEQQDADMFVDEFLRALQEECAEVNGVGTRTAASSDDIPTTLNLDTLRQKGVHKSGYESLAMMNPNYSNEQVFEVLPPTYQNRGDNGAEDVENHSASRQPDPSRQDIVNILLTKTTRRSRSFKDIVGSNDNVSVLEANGSANSIIDWARKAGLDRWQRRAFEILTGTFVLTFYNGELDDDATGRGFRSQDRSFLREKLALERLTEKRKRNSDQLICFLHGPGGSGKTTVLDLMLEYAKEYCSNMENYRFTSRTIVVTAMSGSAATLLLGETTHSALHLNQRRALTHEQREQWQDTRLLIIDEISFADKDDFAKIHENLRYLKEQMYTKYGGMNMVFSGDMRQLEPVKKLPVYDSDCPEFKEWVNCYIELRGMHRFRLDPEWGYILLRWRNGETTEEDIDRINERVVTPDTVLPDDIKYATHKNRDRDAINTALFEERCKKLFEETGDTADCIMIFSDDIQVQNSSKKYIPFQNCYTLWEGCGEDDMKLRPPERMDPVLKLFHKCKMMMTQNKDVGRGLANGTQTLLEKVVLKPNVVPQVVSVGEENIPVRAVRASQVDHIVCRHVNDRIQPAEFSLKPKTYGGINAKILKPKALQVKGKERETLKMKATQVPVVSNDATTGHKLQGTGVENLFVHEWNYTDNWPYVILSRVKTRTGLYLRQPISKDLKKYAMSPNLKRMVERFERQYSPTFWEEDEYDELFNVDV